jgi:subtilase family serine protease
MKQSYPAASRLFFLMLGLALLGFAQPASLRAQTYALPASGTNNFTTCSGTLTDDGGLNAPYSPSANGSTTLTPATAGNKIRLQFTSFSVESGYDLVYIYDGPNTSSPLIGTYDSSNPPTTVFGTTASGALTVRLTSDGVVQFGGFEATIGCVTTVPPQAQADLALQGASLSPLSVVAGGNLSASSSIYNLSGATASSSSVGYYLSTDAVLDAADQLLGSSMGFSLAVGQASSRFANFQVPAGTAPGNYFILFVADYLNQVPESNEGNNVTPVNISVTPPSIDLTIPQAGVTPLNVAPGSPLSLNCQIINQGNAVASSSSVGYYFSTDATLDAADQLLTSQFGGQLSPNFPSSRFGTAAVPPGVAPGAYFILFVADYQNQVGETDENNNVRAVSFTVSPPGVDLVITQEQLFPSSAVAGNFLQVNCLIVNQGNIQANTSTAGFYLSTNQVFDVADVLLSTTQGGTLFANQTSFRSSNPQLPANTAPGSYFVLFVADPQAQVTEVNETNNVRSLPLSVIAPSIDLQVSSTFLNPSSVAPGGVTAASCVLFNQGNAVANPATVGYYLSTNLVLDANDILLANTTGSVFGFNSSSRFANLTVPAGTAVGSYYVLFVADYLAQISETNELNNVTSAPLQVVAPGVDLIIQQPFLSAGSVTPGFMINASCSIQNIGNSIANSSTVGYYLSTNAQFDASDVQLNTVTGFALGGGQSSQRFTNLVIPTGTTAGNYFVLFVADPQAQVTETNENNNVIALQLTVTGPFLGTVVPFSGAATVTTCTATIYDHGGFSNYANNANGTLTILPATPGSLVRLIFNSFVVEQCCDRLNIYDGPNAQSPLLASLSSMPLGPIVATNSAGVLTLVFTSDGIVTASGFEAVVSCVAPPQPDLLLTQIGASPSSVPAGGSLSLSTIVANQGSGSASSSAVGFFLSVDQQLDASDRNLGTSAGGALGPNLDGARNLLTMVPANVTPGAYYVLAVADPTNAVSETNEANNLAALPVTVTQALAIREQTAGYAVVVVPNPVATGHALRVQLSGPGASCVAELSLYNVLGQRVRTQPLALGAGRANLAEVTTQNLATGVYTLRLTGPNLSITRRVVIE